MDESGEPIDRGIKDDPDVLIRKPLDNSLVLTFVNQVDQGFESSLGSKGHRRLLQMMFRHIHQFHERRVFRCKVHERRLLRNPKPMTVTTTATPRCAQPGYVQPLNPAVTGSSKMNRINAHTNRITPARST